MPRSTLAGRRSGTVTEQRQDKRVERSRAAVAAVLAETYRQLSQSGLGGVSIDEVARNSGVAKTTIYRHWPSRSALLIDACSRMGGALPAPDTGSLLGDLRVLATTFAEQLRSAAWPAVLPSIIDAAERDADIAQMQAALLEGSAAPFYIVVERARIRGEVPLDRQVTELIAGVLGPLFYRRWFSREVLDDRFVESVVGAAVQAITGSGAPGLAAAFPSAGR